MAEAGATANAAQSSLNNQLHDAAALGDVAALRAALAAGADVDATKTNTLNGITRTPLALVVNPSMSISDEGRTACVRALLLAGASPSAPITTPGGNRWMPLHEAAFLGLYTVCRLLLEAGADVNAPHTRQDPYTPLRYAATPAHAERNQRVIALLLSRGAVDLPNVDRSGNSSYLKKIRAAGGFSKYERQHRAMLVLSYAPKFSHLLPPELVSVVISLWAHAGLY